MRPKVRRRRLQFQLVFLTLAALTILAGVLLRSAAARWPEWKTRVMPRAARLEASPELARFLDGALEQSHGDWRTQSAELRKRFPFVRTIDARPSWLKRELVLKVDARAAVGRVKGPGTKRLYLDSEGAVFEAPIGLYAEELPVLELKGADVGEWGELARVLAVAGATGYMSSPLQSVKYVSRAEGWSATLEDGTEILWGSLRWTEEKLVRLRAVLEDARARLDPGFNPAAGVTADLRFFEDGRILLRARTGR